MTKVFIADIALLEDDLSVYYDKISGYRLKKSEKLKNYDDKKRSVLAELLLARHLGRVPCYTVDKNGKPIGEEVEFSLSHSGNFAVCAVSDAPVGVDVEKIRHINPEIAKKFSKHEYECIINSPVPENAFFDFWVKRESGLKVNGTAAGIDALAIDGYSYTVQDYDGHKICVCSKEPVAFEFVIEI